MMKNGIIFYKDKESLALTRDPLNDDFQTEHSTKARYARDDDYRSDIKQRAYKIPPQSTTRYTQLHQIPTSPPSPKLQSAPERRYVIESNPKSLNRQLESNTTKPDFRRSSDDRLTERSENNAPRRNTGMLTRVFHYIVAPPIIREAQQKQYEEEEEADNDQEFQIDYSKATVEFGRRLLAETLGTILFILVFGACAIEVGEHRLSRESAAFACGFMSLFIAFSLGPISGSHLNPIVTLAFASRYVFPWIWIPFYLLAQFLGSILAPLFLKLLFRDSDVSFVLNSPQIPIVDAFIWESFLTCCMMFVILQTSTKGKIIGPQAALALSGIFIFIGLVGGNKSSVSLNPFRSVGPALVIKSHKNKDLWLFVVAPVVGTVVALLLSGLLQGFRPKSTSELKAAQGNEKTIIASKNSNEMMDA